MAARQLDHFYNSIPPITRAYATACFATTLLTHLELVSPLDLYLNFPLIYQYEVFNFFSSFESQN